MQPRIHIKRLSEVPRSKASWTRSAALYTNHINATYTRLSKKELSELVYKTQHANGRQREKYTERVLDCVGPLIMRLALQYASSDNYMDYVQDANMAVIDCIDHYDITHCSKSSFITYCVRAIVSRFNIVWSTYHGPVNLCCAKSELDAVARYKDAYRKTFECEPDEEEIMAFCKESRVAYRKYMQDNGMACSIDDNTQNEELSFTLLDNISISANNEDLDPDRWEIVFDNQTIVDDIKSVYRKFYGEINKENDDVSKRQQLHIRNLEILFKYYGVDGYTKQEIPLLANEYGLTESMVRTIIHKTPEDIRSIYGQTQNKQRGRK